MIDLDYVITIHDELIRDLGGLPGFAAAGRGGVEAALERIENHIHYADVNDVFGIAALYAVAIARGHVFNDANKRTGLTCALTYLDEQGLYLVKNAALEEVMVAVAKGEIDHSTLAEYLSALWDLTENHRGALDEG